MRDNLTPSVDSLLVPVKLGFAFTFPVSLLASSLLSVLGRKMRGKTFPCTFCAPSVSSSFKQHAARRQISWQNRQTLHLAEQGHRRSRQMSGQVERALPPSPPGSCPTPSPPQLHIFLVSPRFRGQSLTYLQPHKDKQVGVRPEGPPGSPPPS